MSTTLAPFESAPNPEYVRSLPGLTLVGVVHDHPASVARVRSVLREREPAVLALELPPLAIPLYRSYARDERIPPASGGEMSAAIQTTDARAVGIDGPSRRFVRAFYEYVARERPDRKTLGQLWSSVRTASRNALRCRLAASVVGRKLCIEGERPVSYDCDPESGAEELAADERSQVSMARSAAAFSSPHVAHRDAIREDCMASALCELRSHTVAVVGIDHLDGLVTRLE